MKRFVFRLESCLKLRRHREELEEIRLGELLREKQKVQTEKDKLEESLYRTYEEMTEATEISSEDINLYKKYAVSLEKKIADLTIKLHQLELRIDLQRSILLKARQKRRVVDRLRDRFQKRHQYEQDREIQAEMEELYLLQRGRE